MLVAEIDGVALPDGALLITGGNINGINGLPASAYYGEALTGGLQVDDPNGDIELEGLHVLTVDETACTGAERIWTGWISGRRVGRGPLPYKSGVSRVWDVDIIEANWAFALMVFRASSAKRPAETDLVRMQYIMESAPMAFTPVVDNGRMNYTDNPISFDDSDLVTKYPIEGINEFVGISGKNFYAYWDHTAGELSGHYDLMGVGPTSTLAISNDIADTDSTTFYPFLDAQLTMTGAWTVTGMLLGYRGAYAYGIRQDTIDDLSPTELSPVEFQRDEVYRTDRIGRLDTANATITSMLEQRAVDQTSITVSIRVPASQVNLLEQGDLVSFKATHIPGYETPVEVPVIRRTVVPTEGRVDMYDLHLELSGSPGTAGPGGGDPGPFPYQPTECNPTFVQYKNKTSTGVTVTVTLDNVPTPGNLLVAGIGLRDDSALVAPTGFTIIESQAFDDRNQSCALYYREVQPGDTAVVTSGPGNPSHTLYLFVAEFTGVGLVPTDSAKYEDITHVAPPTPWTMPFGPLNVTAGGVIVGMGIGGSGAADPSTMTPQDGALTLYRSTGPGSGGPSKWFGYKIVTADDPSYEMDVTVVAHKSGQGNISAFFECGTIGTSVPPGARVPVRNEFVAMGDGTTLTFTTRWPFADGSLSVRYDSVDQTPQIVSYDGETGDFTMTGAPIAGQQVFVDYIGR